MGRKGHSITNVDAEGEAGDCSVCLIRVPVKPRTGGREGYTCGVRLRETERNRPSRSKETKRAWWEKNGHRYPTRAKTYRTGDGLPAFKLSIEERQELKQDKACQLCASGERLVIDHCHASGKFRGVLCHRCNVALGMVGDSVPTLLKMVEYLQA